MAARSSLKWAKSPYQALAEFRVDEIYRMNIVRDEETMAILVVF